VFVIQLCLVPLGDYFLTAERFYCQHLIDIVFSLRESIHRDLDGHAVTNCGVQVFDLVVAPFVDR